LSVEKGCLFELAYGQEALYGSYDEWGYAYGIPDEGNGYTCIIWEEEARDQYSIHEARDADIPVIAKLYEKCYERNLLATAIGYKEIDYLKNAYSEAASYECTFYVIKTPSSEICGFFHAQTSDKRLYMMELDDGHSYYQIRPYLMEFYKRHGLDRIPLRLGRDHPAYMVFRDTPRKKEFSEHGYIKIYDMPKFFMEIACVLNARLAGSPYAHYTGTFTLATHSRDKAYKLEFECGKLIDVLPVKRQNGEVNIERNRLVKLMFGRVSPSEFEEEPYVFWFKNDDYRNLFKILFPEMQSHVFSMN